MASERTTILPPIAWEVGEHVAIVGNTGQGKTTLMSQLVHYRNYVAVLRTKPDNIVFKGFKHARDAKVLSMTRDHDHVLIDLTKLRTLRHDQSSNARVVLDEVWRMGRWTLFLDEGYWLQAKLRLQNELEGLLTQGRSLGISIVVGMQRPAWVTRFALSEPTHIFSFRSGDKRDLATIAQTAGSDEFAKVVRALPRYTFAHFYRPTGEIRIGEAHGLPRVLLLPPTLPVDRARRR